MFVHDLRHASILTLSLLVLALVLSPEAHAAIFCATTTAELQSALETADSNGEDDVVHIAQGSYPVPPGGPFTFRGGGVLGGDDNDLSIVGGFVFSNGNPCGLLPPGAGAPDTLLNGESRERVMDINAGAGSDVTIVGVGFLSGRPDESGATRGGGLRLTTFSDTAGTFLVQRSLFINNEADFSSAVTASGASVVRFVNNLAAGNNTMATGAAVELVQNDQTGIYVINNTIVDNTTDAPFSDNAVTGLYLSVGGSSRAYVANNILWGNEFKDIRFGGLGFSTSRNNSIQAAVGSADSSQGNVAIAPVFVPGFVDYNLVPGSSLADIGLNPPAAIPVPPVFESNWALPGEDLDGGPRINDGTVDIGAYETAASRIFSDRFESP